VWHFCIICGDTAFISSDHSSHSEASDRLTISGVTLIPDFVSPDEEQLLITGIETIPWVDSQSGRRKHDYGPKVNFKKQKLKLDCFLGFPQHSSNLLDKLQSCTPLSDFLPVEMCDLEYTPERGSAIDPHFDDSWLWGERLVTLNLLSPITYTLTRSGSREEVLIPIPRRSLIILSDSARHEWMHAIKRGHVTSRRIGITIRELSSHFLPGGEAEELGQALLDKAVVSPEL